MLRNDGLHATLERTKTSGLGKTRQHLPLHVAEGTALLDQDWLPEGWSLWREVASGRDFFVGLPTEDLQGTRQSEALYPDVLNMVRALWAEAEAT